ncbi:peptidase inhibitor family I36 protein [Streptomyces sp. NPDC094448]|uniref:peptidase inhibitor family I36 protein n=1 Tax=Streptomyces sp. NPDC094448 TaxID=3366063 RepID=UPI0037F36549
MRTKTLLGSLPPALALALALGLAPLPAGAAAAPALLPACPPGALCLWADEDFRGPRRVHELAGTDVDSCTALPPGATAAALANRTGRPVTTYQSGECAEHGAFDTYPGSGVWAPRSPYLIRAFRIWER